MRPGHLIAAVLLWTALLAIPLAGADPLAEATPESADLIVVLKAERILYVYRNGLPIHRFPIQLGKRPEGHKREEGDKRTPEGLYSLDWRNPQSKFYKSIHITYPNARDLALIRGAEVNPGGEIMIHGQPTYDQRKREGDWTDGCIAVSNEAMDILWEIIPQDTPIHIYP